jgi:hypothetical protein
VTEADALQAWVSKLSAALDLEPSSVDIALLLDVARDAAHGVARPAAPITTFLVGLAAGQQGGSAEAIAGAASIAQLLATAAPDPLS